MRKNEAFYALKII